MARRKGNFRPAISFEQEQSLKRMSNSLSGDSDSDDLMYYLGTTKRYEEDFAGDICFEFYADSEAGGKNKETMNNLAKHKTELQVDVDKNYEVPVATFVVQNLEERRLGIGCNKYPFAPLGCDTLFTS